MVKPKAFFLLFYPGGGRALRQGAEVGKLNSPANRDLPIIKCCGRLWSPVEILNACLSNDPSFPRLEQILEAHGLGGDSPLDYHEITQARLEKAFKNVHVLIGQVLCSVTSYTTPSLLYNVTVNLLFILTLIHGHRQVVRVPGRKGYPQEIQHT